MVTGQIVAIVVLLGMVLAVAVGLALFRRKNVAQRQIDATRYREEAASRLASAQRLEAEAAERAARARREQDQATELAEMARRDRELAQSRAAQAERLDPDGPWPTTSDTTTTATPDVATTRPDGDRPLAPGPGEQRDSRAGVQDSDPTPQAAR